MNKVLVTDAVHHLLLDGLAKGGYVCDYRPKILLEEVLPIIGDYEGIIINSKIIVDKIFIDQAKQLKFIARLGSGLEIIDLDYTQKKQIAVFRAPDGNCDAVAEQAMGMLLGLANNLRQADEQVRQKIWQREANRGWELLGKTVGIIGFGYTGRAFAKRLAGFGVKVLAYDKYKVDFAEDMPQVAEVSMPRVFEQADIVSFHLPLTSETIALADAKYWERFHKNIIVINTSRGAVIPTFDLLRALDSKKILGACLDVFENEKPNTFSEKEEKIYQELYKKQNVWLSPHVAGWTVESKQRLAQLLLDRILNL